MTESVIWQKLDNIQGLAAAAKLTGNGCSAIDAILGEVLEIKGLIASMPATMTLADFLSIKSLSSVQQSCRPDSNLTELEREIEQRR